ncbi:MAG TPA: hypothetical protein GXX28_00015 [Firmicutes bacterium]|nr:hypothetical protein [Bacillota bacterium]
MPNFKIFQDQPDQARIALYTSTGQAVSADAAGNLYVTAPGGLYITAANALYITAANALYITAANALAVTGAMAMSSLTTDTAETVANNTVTAGAPASTHTVLDLSTWTLSVVNDSLAANAQALVKLQISPDGSTWTDQTAYTTVNQGALADLVSSIFLKYARVYYAAVNAASAITLSIYFQGRT